ncbi:hypothetical protein ILUMI_09446 [Ignelater luminosus]|uniref:Uncharacterized protein n=1 Tax=Ignelater luminosus TaxID=2038154 RepID=A0A8K0G9M9_IGNLU|nr:hypothetical protein ILUMI_09446 [Ignelater luminosus]
MRPENYWWDEEIESKVVKKKKAYKKWIATQDSEERKEYTRISREIKRSVEGNEKPEDKREDSTNLQLTSRKNWQKYYKQLLKEDRAEFQKQNNHDINDGHARSVELTTCDKVQRAIKTSKSGKASGPGAISIELRKAAPSILLNFLQNYLVTVFKGRQTLPSDFKKEIISNIFERGSKHICANCRSITVLSFLGRMYVKILKERIEVEFTDLE